MSTTPIPGYARAPRLRALAASGIFLVVLVGFGVALDAVLPMPDVGDVSRKLAYFARHKDEFDTVFVGSSRVYRQIAPEVFDRQMNAAGGTVSRSFNLGVQSMFLPESLFVVDRILDQRPARLRRMFIELDDPKLRVQEHAALLRREVYWHGPEETALTCANILSGQGIRWRDRLSMLGHQGVLLARRYAHLGRGLEIWSAVFSRPEHAQTSADETALMGAAGDGYAPYRATLGEGAAQTKGDRADVAHYLADVAALRTGRAGTRHPQPATALLRWALRSKIGALRARGIEPCFVIAPVTTGEQGFLRLPTENVPAPVFAFNDPSTYPELYEVSARADTIHLNARGALLFTRLLAERVAAHDRASLSADPGHAVR